MSEWKECKLGDVASSNLRCVTKDYAFKIIQYLDTGSIIRGKVESLQEIPITNAPSRAKRLVSDGDIVYSNVRPVQRHYGLIKNPPENLVVSTGFSVITVNKDKADPRFIYHLLSSDEIVEYLDSVAEGSTSAYPSLKPSDIDNLTISLPPLPEQKAIAAVLSSLDDKIDLLHRQNKTLEAMAEALFREWFVEPCKNGLPEGWEEKPIGELFNISSGKALKKEQLLNDGIYPVLGANGEIGRTDKYLYDEKLIFTGRVGTLGNIFIVDNKRVWLSDNTLVIRPKRYFYFVYFILKISKLEEYNVGSTQPLIRQSDINGIETALPPEEVMKKFECQADVLYSKINSNNSQIRTLEKLRDTLLPKLMSGEVRVEI